MRSFAFVAALLCVPGCSDEHSCTAMACLNDGPSVALVNDTGQGVAARGELELNGTVRAFDCATPPPLPAPPPTCTDNVVLVHDFNDVGNGIARIRFQLPGGSMTPWQGVPLDITTHEDPDFNGPGCPCTSYSATAEPAVVPEAARLTPVSVDAGSQ